MLKTGVLVQVVGQYADVGKKDAFSSCASHFTVVLIFYENLFTSTKRKEFMLCYFVEECLHFPERAPVLYQMELNANENITGANLWDTLSTILRGEEGRFTPNILENKEALELLKTAIAKAGYTDQVVIGMDVAASDFYRSGKYDLDFKPPDDPSRYITPDQLADLYMSFIQSYPVVSTEDPFNQDDWNAWQKFTAGAGIQVVGDDLTVTNPKRIAKAAGEKSCNCLLLKVNQIGSVTESLQACKLAQSNGWGVMVSRLSGETEDTFIVDLVVGLCTGQIKTGAPCQSERLAKYNQILRIEEELSSKAKFAGWSFRNPLAK
ncbi:alpha-enolase-like [Mastomys coucha]|uniref:alpha-enolase-like n=1 Tax=Mastomys coucha TaxID=35658 RepID=UPI001261AF03|nr:alpha-enolase-like [Mastomys coucha]